MASVERIPKWSIEFQVFLLRKGMNIADVCRLTGLSQASISGYRQGKKRPSVTNCIRIKRTIGFDMLEAIYLSDKKEMEDSETNESKI